MIYARLTVKGIKMASLQPHCAGLSTAPHNPVAMSGATEELLKMKRPGGSHHPGRVQSDVQRATGFPPLAPIPRT